MKRKISKELTDLGLSPDGPSRVTRMPMEGNRFRIEFQENWFRRKDILETPDGYKLKIIKVYRMWWWKKILLWLGFSVARYKGILVEKI